MSEELFQLLEQAACEGVIECPKCGTTLEPDAEKCPECGWQNILRDMGFI